MIERLQRRLQRLITLIWQLASAQQEYQTKTKGKVAKAMEGGHFIGKKTTEGTGELKQ